MLAFIAALTSVFMNAWRWQLLVKTLGFNFGLGIISKISFECLFFNVYFPGGILGDVTRIAYLPKKDNTNYRNKSHVSNAAASVFTDRIIGLLGLMILACAGFAFVYQVLLKSELIVVFVVVCGLLLGVIMLFFSRRIQKVLKKRFKFLSKLTRSIEGVLSEISESFLVYRDNPYVFCPALLLSVAGHLFMVFCFYLLSRAIGLNIGVWVFIAVVPIIELLSAMPISIGGAGVREIATITLFSYFGVSTVDAMSLSLMVFMIILLLGAIGGIFSILRHGKKLKSPAL